MILFPVLLVEVVLELPCVCISNQAGLRETPAEQEVTTKGKRGRRKQQSGCGVPPVSPLAAGKKQASYTKRKIIQNITLMILLLST